MGDGKLTKAFKRKAREEQQWPKAHINAALTVKTLLINDSICQHLTDAELCDKAIRLIWSKYDVKDIEGAIVDELCQRVLRKRYQWDHLYNYVNNAILLISRAAIEERPLKAGTIAVKALQRARKYLEKRKEDHRE